MSLDGLQSERERFNNFKRDLFNAHHTTLKTQSEADDEPTPERLDAATAARETEAAICRKFREWSTRKRDIDIPQILNDAAQVFENTERPGWQEFHETIVEHLPTLEADCPIGDDPQPPRPLGTARRWRG